MHYKFLISPRLPQGHSLPLRQLIPLNINTYCDSDWATDIDSRKSTSGTVTSVLQVPLAFNSRTQSTVATSSAEAELYAIGLGISDSLHIYQLLQELQQHLQPPTFDFGNLDTQYNIATSTTTTPLTSTKSLIHIFTDSTSALSLSNKLGLNKMSKHIALRYLFVQDIQATGLVNIQRVTSHNNPADIYTKCVTSAIWSDIFVTTASLNCTSKRGRSTTSTSLNSLSSTSMPRRTKTSSTQKNNYKRWRTTTSTQGNNDFEYNKRSTSRWNNSTSTSRRRRTTRSCTSRTNVEKQHNEQTSSTSSHNLLLQHRDLAHQSTTTRSTSWLHDGRVQEGPRWWLHPVHQHDWLQHQWADTTTTTRTSTTDHTTSRECSHNSRHLGGHPSQETTTTTTTTT